MASAPSVAVNFAGFLLLIIVINITTATAYTNHTVGDSTGWHFNTSTNTSATDYSAWASNQTFSLGDYLIFKTTTNQTVIQTYNATNYQLCSADDDDTDGDTFQYEGGATGFDEALTIEVPLTITGVNYYFSGAGAGVQCQRGMAFNITVARGQGLPDYLNQPPPPPYVAPSPPSTEAMPSPPTGNDGGVMRVGYLRMAAVGLCVVVALLFV